MGFFPFKLLYGRQVTGLLDMLGKRENRVASKNTNESTVSYVINIREKMDRMAELVQQEFCQSPDRTEAMD